MSRISISCSLAKRYRVTFSRATDKGKLLHVRKARQPRDRILLLLLHSFPALPFLSSRAPEVRKKRTEPSAGSILRSRTASPPSFRVQSLCKESLLLSCLSPRFTFFSYLPPLSPFPFIFSTIQTVFRDDNVSRKDTQSTCRLY